jgi:hypothetical protein
MYRPSVSIFLAALAVFASLGSALPQDDDTQCLREGAVCIADSPDQFCCRGLVCFGAPGSFNAVSCILDRVLTMC